MNKERSHTKNEFWLFLQAGNLLKQVSWEFCARHSSRDTLTSEETVCW